MSSDEEVAFMSAISECVAPVPGDNSRSSHEPPADSKNRGFLHSKFGLFFVTICADVCGFFGGDAHHPYSGYDVLPVCNGPIGKRQHTESSGGDRLYFSVDASGTVTPAVAAAATGSGNTLTFTTTPVMVDPGNFIECFARPTSPSGIGQSSTDLLAQKDR